MKKTAKKLIAMLLVIAIVVPTFGMMYSSAAAGDTVELAFNNIFVFESWANNSLSSTVLLDGVPQKTGLVTDVENGSFTLEKQVATGTELFTAFSMDSTNATANEGYYKMDVEPNTTYTFSYNITGNTYVFTPYVFFFDNAGLWIPNGLVAYGTPGYGYNEFSFTTPANANAIQIRFTVGDNSSAGNTGASTVTATVKDIAIYESALKSDSIKSQNMFDFEAWANNEYSSKPSSLSPDNGTVTTDVATGTIGLTCTSGNFWTGFGIDSNASNDAYYTIDVDPSKSYTLSYDVTNISLPGAVHCQPWIVELDSDGKCVTFYQNDKNLQYGANQWQISNLQSNTARVQIVFSIAGVSAEAACEISNIGFYDTAVFNSDFETLTGYPYRLTYTEGAGTYGELPVPANVPSGKVFAGWFTGKNGSGEAVTADTEISYKSQTVYPYFQTAVDSLAIKNPPVKTTYTLGEKLNTTGLVLEATVTDANGKDSTFDISSGYVCSPTVLTSSGTQAITVSYGGKTATFNVDVSLFNEKTIPVNDTEVVVQVANNVYTMNYTAPEAFSRYEITYYSDSYVKGTITMADGTYEEFFLEPSTNGSFASYIDDYLTGGTYSDIKSIGFECLNKEFGTFELYSVETVYVEKPADTMAYYENDRFKAGINLAWGGVLAYLQDLNQTKPVMSATYADGITKVNYEGQLPSGATSTSSEVNLINTFDKGRYVQQSYYGTREEPYVLGNYNGVEWNYNPIQGGNILGEAAKVVDYRITDTEIYVKTRPLEWAKWSDEAGAAYNAIQPDDSLDKELIYEDSYNPWAYMESWYVFEDGIIKTYCRYVDYSGYPSATTTQEFPAFYCVEPLNNFVYYAGGEAWNDATNTAQWASDLDFWGASPEYNEMLIANGQSAVDPHFNCNENWAAFMGGTTNEDFGIGIYTADVTDFVAGSFMSKYKEGESTLVPQETSLRHADTLDPATENPTSYIAPINTMELTSYKEYTYAYYITTGTQEEIREDFRRAVDEDTQTEYAKTKIAVPETAYMTPATSPDSTTKVGQYYVNNILDSSDYYNIKTEADAKAGMYFGVHSGGATQYKISVTNATNPADDIILGNADGTGNIEGTWYDMSMAGNDIKENVLSMRFASTGLAPGKTATAKWEITMQYEDGTTKTYNAYTVMYAPMTTVGAVAESRENSSLNNEVSSWITGANGIDHSRTAPLGSFYADASASGYFKFDPLAFPEVKDENGDGVASIAGTSESADDYINVATDSSGYYVQQTATNGQDDSRSHSYLGLLAIDKSRYSNTNQIPNLKIGYDALRVASGKPEDSLETYTTYYTLGTAEAYTATDYGEAPSGWTTNDSYTELYNEVTLPYRSTVVPSYVVSDSLDGQYIHAIAQGRVHQAMAFSNSYATAGTSVLIDVTDKSALRDAVTDGYTLPSEDYSDDSYSKFEKELGEAATVLGDPSASQDEIDQAQKELEDAKDELVNTYYALKYDNLFSAYEYSQKLGSMKMNVTSNASINYTPGTLTIISDNVDKADGDVYATEGSTSDFYNIKVKPSTEYVFEYDLTTTAGSQVLLFFYDANGNQVASTNQTMQINSGNPSTLTSTPHLAAYVHNNGHVVLKFTTNANIDRIGFRFGNANNVVDKSTFTNIRLIEADKYYADAEYSKTESVYKEFDTYGTLITPVRPGYTFTGWVYEDGTAATSADLATAHKSIYSTWKMNPRTFEDAVVIDYGLPVRINVCVNDHDLGAGTLTGIATELADGAQTGTNSYDKSQLVAGVKTGLKLANGTASIDGDTIVYTPSNTPMSSESEFYYEFKTADGKYYYATVTVIPATNIYYEESFITFTNGDGYVWEDVGSPITGRFQEEDRPGNFSFAEYDANNPYGKDSAYDDSYTYSMGSAKKAVVDAAAFGKEPTAKFTFSGTGFDLFSVTNSDTGAVLVTIYEADTQKIVKNFLVSTYYGYTVDDAGALLPDTESADSMYQVPVISYRDLNYATYDVVIKPLYSSAFDPNYVKDGEDSENAYSIYVDSVRIFNPINPENIASDVVLDAYYQDGEYAPKYMEIRNTILSAEEYYNEVIENLQLGYTGSLFIDGNSSNGIDKTGIATYKTQGPNNEIYLGKNQAVAFNINAADAYTLASLQLGMKVVSGGETAEVVIMNTNDKNPNKIEISGAHEQFHKLNSAIIWNQNEIDENNVYQTVYPIVIVNTSDTVISLTTFKWAHTVESEASENSLTFNVNHSTGEMANYAVRRVMNNNTANTVTDENVSIKWSDDTFTVGKEATLMVTTPVDVVAVTVDGIEITDCSIDENGNKVWTYTFVVQQSGETDYEILFFDRNGMVDECVKTETITVEKAPAGDADTPEEPGADITESIFEIILNFIKKLLNIIGGVFA